MSTAYMITRPAARRTTRDDPVADGWATTTTSSALDSGANAAPLQQRDAQDDRKQHQAEGRGVRVLEVTECRVVNVQPEEHGGIVRSTARHQQRRREALQPADHTQDDQHPGDW